MAQTTEDIKEAEDEAKLDSDYGTNKWYGTGGWLPHIAAIHEWRNDTIKRHCQTDKDLVGLLKDDKVKPVIKELIKLIINDQIIWRLVNEMIEQDKTLHGSIARGGVPSAAIGSVKTLVLLLNHIIGHGPSFHNGHLIGVPIAAAFTGVNATLAGEALFRLKPWNDALTAILQYWAFECLDKQESFPGKGENSWLSDDAQALWNPNRAVWKKETKEFPHWSSWNKFFSRHIHREKYRPLPKPDSDNIIISSNDGTFFRYRENIKEADTFWLKDMPYSLFDIFGGKKGDNILFPTNDGLKKLNKDNDKGEDNQLLKYVDDFSHGKIFQTFLNPFNFHRWWAPVSGTILVAAIIPGYYFSKLKVPDIDGATTESCPYLTNVNARGIVVINTNEHGNFGNVCCIPIGMVEVSSIIYNDKIKPGAKVTKGEELGYFQFGGSSFATIFEDNPRKYQKAIEFIDGTNKKFPKTGKTPTPTGGVGIVIKAGSQIGAVVDACIV